MLLVITNSDDATADFLCKRLEDQCLPYLRFDTDRDFHDVAIGFSRQGLFLQIRHSRIVPQEIQNVWFRRPLPITPPVEGPPAELAHIANEWTEAIEGFLSHIPRERWMNYPADNAGASHKIEQLSRATQLGLSTPETIVTQDPSTLRAFWRDAGGDLIVKPLSSGHLERNNPQEDSLVYTNRVKDEDLADLSILSRCPTFFQRRVDKLTDVRIVFVDGELIASSIKADAENTLQMTDIRRDNMEGVTYESVSVPKDVEEKLLTLIYSYGLRFAAIDMAIAADGRWFFFEVNPNGQWAWLDIVGGCDIAASFIRAFKGSPK